MRQSAVVLLALGEERRKETDNVLHETGEAFKEPGDVGGVVDIVKGLNYVIGWEGHDR